MNYIVCRDKVFQSGVLRCMMSCDPAISRRINLPGCSVLQLLAPRCADPGLFSEPGKAREHPRNF